MTLFSNDAGEVTGSKVLGDEPVSMDQDRGLVISDPLPGPDRGKRSEMKSTESISASDHPFFGVDRQHFGKKRLPSFRNRRFHPRIGSLALNANPEMTLFSNDAGAFSGTCVLGGEPVSMDLEHGLVIRDPLPGPERGRRSEVHSTEFISASDYPFFWVDRQHFGKKRLPSSGNRPFHPPIGSLALIACPEMTLFSNDTGAFSGNKVLGGELVSMDLGRGPVILDPLPGPDRGRRSEVHSTEFISASDYPFFGVDRQHFGKKRLPSSGNRPFHPRIGRLALIACPEMTLFSNDTEAFSGTRVLGDDPRCSVKETPWLRFRLSPDQRGSEGGMTGAGLAWNRDQENLCGGNLL
jgi:hypothetical protein